MYTREIIFSYLYPFSEKFYSNYGYGPSSSSIRWSFDLATIPAFSYEGTFHLYRGEGSYSDYEQVYLEFARKYNMMVHRDNFDWSVLKNANPFKGKRQAYLYKDCEGNPRGYFIFEKSEEQEQPVMDCKEIIFDSFITLKTIMSFIKSFSSHYNKVAFHAPRSLSLEYFCSDYSQSASKRQILQNGMVRVINAAKVLEQATYRGDGELCIQLLDTYLENNNKVFHIIYYNGKAEKITAYDAASFPFSDTLENTSTDTSLGKKEADIVMTINQFSAAIVGNYDVTDLDYQEGVTLNCSKEKAAQLIYKKPNWINNFF
jgi:predicted acetyltransferase